jgi:hypothetical protein
VSPAPKGGASACAASLPERRKPGNFEARDYTDGELSAANYERLSRGPAVELDAARAEREQAERHAPQLDAGEGEIGNAILHALGDVHEPSPRS